ncbi:sigma 54-interacting transcriptional regulator, partial [Candidatus Woesearchaeota archaeon]|nr:sigma 54-interacting transcriptional regulator [Candidatus Woesearchaeota archaeon]
MLRFLDNYEVRRIGAAAEKVSKVDVRIVTATSADLEELVKEGKFIGDLQYRLAATTLAIPPLRERREDIPPLVSYFLNEVNRRWERALSRPELNGTGWKGPFNPLDDKATERLVSYGWPGNVRQLKYAIEQAALVSHVQRGDRIISADDIGTVIDEETHVNSSSIREFKKKGPIGMSINNFLGEYGDTVVQRTIDSKIKSGEI